VADYTASIALTAEDRASSVLKAVSSNTQTLSNQVQGLSGSFMGMAAAVGGLAAVGAAMKAVVGQAMGFQGQTESSQLAIASMVKSFMLVNGAAVGHEQAMEVAKKAQQGLRIAALETAFEFTELLDAFQTMMPAAVQAGFATGQVVDFTKTIAQLAASTKLPLREVSSQISLVLAGVVSAEGRVGSLFKNAGVSPVTLALWKAQGTTFQNMTKIMQGFADMAPYVNKTWSAAWSNLKDAFNQALGEGGGQLFASAKKAVFDLTDSIVKISKGDFEFNPKLIAGITAFLNGVGALVAKLSTLGPALLEFGAAGLGAFGDLAGAVVPFIDVLTGLFKVLTPVVEAFGGMAAEAYVAARAFGLLSAAIGGKLATWAAAEIAALTATAASAAATVAAAAALELEAAAASHATTAVNAHTLTMEAMTVTTTTATTATVTATGVLGALTAGVTALQVALVAIPAAIAAIGLWMMKLHLMDEENAGNEAWATAAEQTKEYIKQIQNVYGVTLTAKDAEASMTLKLSERKQVYELMASASLSYADASQKVGAQLKAIAAAPDLAVLEKLGQEITKLKGSIGSIGTAELTKSLLDLQTQGAVEAAKITAEIGKTSNEETKKLLQEKLSLTKEYNGKQAAELVRAHGVEMAAAHRKIVEDIKKVQEDTANVLLEGTEKEVAALDARLEAEIRASTETMRVATQSREWTKEELAKKQADQDDYLEALKEKTEAEKALMGRDWLRQTMEESATLFREGLAKQGREIEAGMLLADHEFEAGYKKLMQDVNSGVIQTQAELEKAFVNLSAAKALKAPQSFWEQMKAQITSIQEKAKEGVLTVTERARAMASVNEKAALESGDGQDAAFQAYLQKVRKNAESTRDYLLSVWDAIGKGFEDSVYSVISGKVSSLGDVLKGVWDSILRSFSKMVTEMVQSWITGQYQMKLFGARDGGAGGGMGIGEYAGSGESIDAGLGGGAGLGAIAGGLGIVGGVGTVAAGGGGVPYRATGAYIGAALGYVAALLTQTAVTAIAVGLTSAATGATIGSAWPVIGTIIGAIVGAIIGILSSPNTEGRVPIRGSEMFAHQGFDPMWKTVANSTSGMTGTISDILRQGTGVDAPAFVAEMNRLVMDYLKTMAFEVHAGSDEDMQAGVKKIFSEIIPKEILAVLMGLKNLGQNDLPGITGPAKWGGEVNREAPIAKMLLGLDMTLDKVQEIADRVNVDTPETIIAYLKKLVGVLITADTLVLELGKSVAEQFATLADLANETAVSKLKKTVAGITGRGAEIGTYTGDEQLNRAETLVTDINAAYQQMMTAIDALRQAIDSFSRAANDLVTQSSDALKAPQERKDDVTRTAWGAWDKVTSATNPADAQKFANEGLAAFQALLQAAISWHDAALKVEADIKGMLSVIDGTADKFKTVADIQNELAKASTMTGEAQMAQIADVAKAAFDMWQANSAAIAALKAEALALGQSITDLITQSRDALKSPGQRTADLEYTAWMSDGKVAAATTWADAKKAAEEGIAAYKSLLSAAIAWHAAALQAQQTISDAIAEMSGAANPLSSITGIAGELAAASNLSGQAQVDAINRVSGAALTMWRANEQAIAAIAQMAKGIHESIQDQIFGLDLSGKSKRDQADVLQKELQSLYDQLQAATDPAEIQRLTSRIQSLGSQYIGTFDQNDPNRAAAVEWLKTLLSHTDESAKRLLGAASKGLEDANKKLREIMDEAGKLIAGNVTAAANAIGTLITSLGLLTTAIDAAAAKFTTDLEAENVKLRAVLEEAGKLIHDNIIAAANDITLLQNGIISLRIAFETAMTGFADELLKAAQPLAIELQKMLDILRGTSDPGTGGGNGGSGGGGGGGGLNEQTTRSAANMGLAADAAGRLATALDSLANGKGSNGQAPIVVLAGGGSGGGNPEAAGRRAAAYLRNNPTSLQSRLGR
jgi:hypothetical protein